MHSYTSNMIKNIAVLSHDGAGKTAVVESFLLTSGAITSNGKGASTQHIMDFEPEEIQRNVTIQMAMAPCQWQGHKLNFIDTPGYFEFSGEVQEALRASDGMLLVIAASAGVEVDTERAWHYGTELNLPKMIFINKLDLDNADFFATLQQLRKVFGKSIMPLQIPIGSGANFQGIIDVVKMQAWRWQDGKAIDIDIPPQYSDKAKEIREMALEAAAEGDDDLLAKYLEGEPLTIEEIRHGLRQGMLTGNVCPVMCGSATQRIGIEKVLDRIIRYLPDASQRRVSATNLSTKESINIKLNHPFSALVFKTVIDPFIGKLSFIRIFSGELNEGDKLYNQTQACEEKFSKMFSLIGKQQQPQSSAKAGDIVVLAKLNETKTGDTLAAIDFPIQYPSIGFPQPVHTVALLPAQQKDEDKLLQTIDKIMEEDLTCYIEKSNEGQQLLLHCMGEVHLEHLLAKMERKYGVNLTTQPPYIPYRETIARSSSAEGKYKKQSGGHGQYGQVFLQIEPLTNGKEFEFTDTIVGGAVPKQYIPAVEKGAQETLANGLIAGYPLINIKVTLTDGSFHSVDSSELAFKMASAIALRQAVPNASPRLLEPIYNINILAPEECMGDIIGDLSSKRGQILGMQQTTQDQVIELNALVPLANMNGYVTQLRSMTQGRGTYSMSFANYEEMPTELAAKIIAARKKEAAEA